MANAKKETKAPICINLNGEQVKVSGIEIEDIMEYCVANNAVEWLQEVASKEVPAMAYPRKKVEARDENGNIIYKTKKDKTGATVVTNVPKMISIADKSAGKVPTGKMRKASFVEIKSAFIDKFFPEAKAEKEANMYDLIAKLGK